MILYLPVIVGAKVGVARKLLSGVLLGPVELYHDVTFITISINEGRVQVFDGRVIAPFVL